MPSWLTPLYYPCLYGKNKASCNHQRNYLKLVGEREAIFSLFFLFTTLKAETTYLRRLLTRPIANQVFINHSDGSLSPSPET